MIKRVQLNVPMPEDLYEEVKAHCKRYELTMAGLARRLLKEHLAPEETFEEEEAQPK